jgi:hypothetical protein
MIRPIAVKPFPDWKLEVIFKDGVMGFYDMSQSIGKGVFSPLKDPVRFSQVRIGEFGQIAWSDEMEICSDSVYKELSRENSSHAYAR